jgi:hypothetical protein
LIHSSAPQAKFVKSVIGIDSIKAAYILKYFVDRQLNTIEKPFEAAISAMLFESKVNSESLVDSQEILNQANKILGDIQLYHRDDSGWALKSCLKKVQSKYQKLAYATQKEQISSLDSQGSNDKILTLLSTVKYWDKTATDHKMWTGMLIIGIVGVCMFVGMYIWKMLAKFAGSVTWQNIQYGNTATYLLLVIAGILAIRFFIQALLNQVRLLRDAQERSSMVLMYLALLEKNTMPDGYERDLILQSLFASIISRCVSGVDAFFDNEYGNLQEPQKA